MECESQISRMNLKRGLNGQRVNTTSKVNNSCILLRYLLSFLFSTSFDYCAHQFSKCALLCSSLLSYLFRSLSFSLPQSCVVRSGSCDVPRLVICFFYCLCYHPPTRVLCGLILAARFSKLSIHSTQEQKRRGGRWLQELTNVSIIKQPDTHM